jgi:hypothetical protein
MEATKKTMPPAAIIAAYLLLDNNMLEITVGNYR